MPFVKGQPKPAGSGRKSGARNRYVIPSFEDILGEEKLNPLIELKRLLPDLQPNEQAEVWLKLLPYVYSKKKEAEPKPQELFDVTPGGDDTQELLAIVNGNRPKSGT